jgi:hypothetical protein
MSTDQSVADCVTRTRGHPGAAAVREANVAFALTDVMPAALALPPARPGDGLDSVRGHLTFAEIPPMMRLRHLKCAADPLFSSPASRS